MEDPSWGRVTQKQRPAGWSRFQGRSQKGPQIQEKDTGVCVVTGLGTETLCSRQQHLQMSKRTPSFINSLIHSLAHPFTSSFICLRLKTLLTGRRPVSRSPCTHLCVPQVVSAYYVPSPEFYGKVSLSSPSKRSGSHKVGRGKQADTYKPHVCVFIESINI